VPALMLGAPALGFVLGACGWVLQRMLAVIDRRWTSKATDPVRELVMNLFEAFGRIWLLAGVIVLAALLGKRPDGLTAAVVIIGAYSVAFVIRLLSGPPGRRAGE
jgi:ABC-type methionine transport system permease subunit